MEKNALNNSVVKAFEVINQFNAQNPEWGVRALAKHLGTNQSTTYRIMATLESIGILSKDEVSSKYRLGIKLFTLGNRVDSINSFVSISHPELIKVSEEITETVHLGTLQNLEVLMLDKVESPKGLKLNSVVGSNSPAYCTGIGKVLLAYQTSEYLNRFFNQVSLKPLTSKTKTTEKELKEELFTIRKKGFGIDFEEKEEGLICVAIPIYNQQNEVIAALSAAGPSQRFGAHKVNEYVNMLQKGANAIQQKIGTLNFNF